MQMKNDSAVEWHTRISTQLDFTLICIPICTGTCNNLRKKSILTKIQCNIAFVTSKMIDKSGECLNIVLVCASHSTYEIIRVIESENGDEWLEDENWECEFKWFEGPPIGQNVWIWADNGIYISHIVIGVWCHQISLFCGILYT